MKENNGKNYLYNEIFNIAIDIGNVDRSMLDVRYGNIFEWLREYVRDGGKSIEVINYLFERMDYANISQISISVFLNEHPNEFEVLTDEELDEHKGVKVISKYSL